MIRSYCCDAKIIMGDICSNCKKHCSPIQEEGADWIQEINQSHPEDYDDE